MKVIIHGLDYTSALAETHAVAIERKLNEPSKCKLWFTLPLNDQLGLPTRGQSVAVTDDDGTAYFTGTIMASPIPEWIGQGIEGPRYSHAIVAISDEILFDQLSMPSSAGIAGETAGSLIRALIKRSGRSALAVAGTGDGAEVSDFSPNPGALWSECVQKVADMARNAYRIMDGTLALIAVESVIHQLGESQGNVNPANLNFTACLDRMPVNDVTVCGETEPVSYVTEYFLGDGVTANFYLSADPYFGPASKTTIIREQFSEPEIDARIWSNSGDSGYFEIGAGGFSMRGGSGVDGETVMSWLDPAEMGGTLLLETIGLILQAGSTGVISGFFDGGTELLNCAAGIQVLSQQNSTSVLLQPIVQGTAVGTAYTVSPSNEYTVRLRVHSAECHRSTAIYRSSKGGDVVTAGGAWIIGPGKVQFEVQEFVNGVGGMPVTLYDGAVASLPGVCTVVVASSQNLKGSIRAIYLTNLGSAWVVTTPAAGGARARRMGLLTQAGECQLDRDGKLQFQTGNVPAVGEEIAVFYRTAGRAVGRAVNFASQQERVQLGLSAVASWVGSVTEPPARSSADCRNAALVTAQTAARESSLLRGVYRGTNREFTDDVWPGDALQLSIPSANVNAQVIVRHVRVSYKSSLPDLVEYEINFANEWAEDLAIKRNNTVPANAWLAVPAALSVLPNLTALSITSVNGSTVSINTGVMPPAGGGFEVRRRDSAFMAGTDPDLVTRTAEPNITFSRESANDRFYVRMYDGATPPNYSEFSAALFINLPLGA